MIAIPNMSKPKSCWECWLMDGEANCLVTDEGIPFKQEGILPDCPLIDIVTCGECKHRDPEDKKCDCGMFERQGCIFPVADDYFCKYGERRTDENI